MSFSGRAVSLSINGQDMPMFKYCMVARPARSHWHSRGGKQLGCSLRLWPQSSAWRGLGRSAAFGVHGMGLGARSATATGKAFAAAAFLPSALHDFHAICFYVTSSSPSPPTSAHPAIFPFSCPQPSRGSAPTGRRRNFSQMKTCYCMSAPVLAQ